MPVPSAREITELLQAWRRGNPSALERLVPLVEAELHRLAHRYLAKERPGHTLQTTALVNEAYLRSMDWKNVQWQDRTHFVGIAAHLMRHILAGSPGANRTAELRLSRSHSIEQVMEVSRKRSPDLVALDDALNAPLSIPVNARLWNSGSLAV